MYKIVNFDKNEITYVYTTQQMIIITLCLLRYGYALFIRKVLIQKLYCLVNSKFMRSLRMRIAAYEKKTINYLIVYNTTNNYNGDMSVMLCL